MRVQHIVPISGGKDSTGVACLMVERLARRPAGNLLPRFLHCDVGGNENSQTMEYIDYLSDWLEREIGQRIEILRADFSEGLAARRANIEREWKTRKEFVMHDQACRAAQAKLDPADRPAHRKQCGCRVEVREPLSDEIIAEAKALLEPTGDPFLDLCLLKGRFPGTRSRFCTDELKLEPMRLVKVPIWQDGISTVEWIGERADESPARAAKPRFQRIRRPEGRWVNQILYRPVHHLKADDMFSIAARHGLSPNPLYLQGARRVGCWPCIMCGKDEIVNIANRTPDHIDRLREWEKLVSKVSRRQWAAFFPDRRGLGSDDIDEQVAWARTSRGGKQFDLLRTKEMISADADGLMCDSAYGLCE